jgi:hypothetical protein
MNGAYSLLGEAASAVADIKALIWRISRSSVDGCITFSFDRGPNQLIPDFGSAQVGKSQDPSCWLRQIVRASTRFSDGRTYASRVAEPGNIRDTVCR